LAEGWSQWLRQQYEAGADAALVFSVVVQIADELGALLETRREYFGVAVQWENEWDSDEDLFAAVKNSGRRKGARSVRIHLGKRQRECAIKRCN
jgi:hypothetical protein